MRRLALALLVAGCADPSVGEGSYASFKSCADGTNNTQGIDVSGYQPNTDWSQASTVLDFAIIKSSEGVSYTNPWFAHDWKETKKYGMVRGAYCFFRAGDDPIEEADYYLTSVTAAGGFEYGDIAALDLECPTDSDCSPASTVAANALAFMQRVKEKTGITPIIYTSARVFDQILSTPDGFTKYPLWDANWGVSCPTISSAWPKWAFWQFAGDSMTFPGVSGNNDGDEFNGTKDELVTFANSLWLPEDAPDAGVVGGGVDAGKPGQTGGDLRGGCAVGGRPAGGVAWFLTAASLVLWRTRRRSSRRTR